MLASITPLGGRGRWTVTVVAFALGALGAAVVAGAVLGLAGSLAGVGRVGVRSRAAVLGVLAVGALAIDLGPRRVPGPRRQVNERWRYEYRAWVVGLGYGAQLGMGVTTIVSSAATYVALAAALLSASVYGGAVIMAVYGLVRGLTPLAAAGVRRPEELQALHRRLLRARRPARRLGLVALAGVALTAIAATLAG